MKKLFATLACVALLSAGFSTVAMAQNADSTAAAAQVDSAAAPAAAVAAAPSEADATAPAEAQQVETSFHQSLKTKFIEGGADFMAKGIARDTRGPIASIAYQALLRADQGIDIAEKSVVSYGGVQGGLLEKNLSWITLFIAMAPSLGFLGTVVGMVLAFDNIERVGDISPTVVAGGMKVALITTIGGLVVALILQIFYNYILSLVEGILNRMEDASISLLDIIVKYNVKNNK